MSRLDSVFTVLNVESSTFGTVNTLFVCWQPTRRLASACGWSTSPVQGMFGTSRPIASGFAHSPAALLRTPSLYTQLIVVSMPSYLRRPPVICRHVFRGELTLNESGLRKLTREMALRRSNLTHNFSNLCRCLQVIFGRSKLLPVVTTKKLEIIVSGLIKKSSSRATTACLICIDSGY